MRTKQFYVDVREGECQECGMIGLLIAKGHSQICEDCEREMG